MRHQYWLAICQYCSCYQNTKYWPLIGQKRLTLTQSLHFIFNLLCQDLNHQPSSFSALFMLFISSPISDFQAVSELKAIQLQPKILCLSYFIFKRSFKEFHSPIESWQFTLQRRDIKVAACLCRSSVFVKEGRNQGHLRSTYKLLVRTDYSK